MYIGRIPRNRLTRIPKEQRLAHDYCFFLHDECTRALVEYEAAKANLVSVKFGCEITAAEFHKVAAEDPLKALTETGHPDDARRVILNAVTMGMVSDCLHHIYEALRCFEKRKIVVAFNLLRKPLKQNLLYLAWMFGDEDAFYQEFMSGNPENVSGKKLGNIRQEIFAKAIAKMPSAAPFAADIIESLIFDRRCEQGFERAFEHAVHLVTVGQLELRTSPQNFNFIFKSYADDDTYEALYSWLPYLMFFLSQCVVGCFDRMRPMDEGTRTAIFARGLLGFGLLGDPQSRKMSIGVVEEMLAGSECGACSAPLKVTPFNAAKIVITDSFRCTTCGTRNAIAFSWMFGPLSWQPQG